MNRHVVTLLCLAAALAVKGSDARETGKSLSRPSLTEKQLPTDRRLYRQAPEGNLFAHLYYPADWQASDRRPAIVFFFGGGWRKGSHKQFQPQAEYFASRGLVAISADYRIRSQHGTTPAEAVQDAKTALQWVRAHAQELGVDPNKIIAAGGSAGGHLAAAAALAPGSSDAEDEEAVSCKPNALVLFNPVVDLTRLPKTTLRGGLNSRVARALSPLFYLNEAAPPMILFYGNADKYLPQGEQFAEKANELGLRAELYIAPGQSHGFFNRSPWTEVTAAKADEFLASLGYLEGKPTIQLPKDAPQLQQRGGQ